MKVLMFGWEFPPIRTGGLGTACHDLCKGLSNQACKITFVMPSAPNSSPDFVRLVGIPHLEMKPVSSLLSPYQTINSYNRAWNSSSEKSLYGEHLLEEVKRFTAGAANLAKSIPHDIIHCHDWMTYGAGIAATKASGKPLVTHVHAIEQDRTAGHPNPEIEHFEKQGLDAASAIIANSIWTRNNILRSYNVNPNNVHVVHWGIAKNNPAYHTNYKSPLTKTQKMVVYAGRMTVQKGPDYFVAAAKLVAEKYKNASFLMVGGGDMLASCIQNVASLGLQDRFLFTGAVPQEQVYKAFQTADLFVMPSVSEPFGLVALEALKNGAPVLLSKQSGVAEVVTHCLTADFWDVKDIASKILGVLNHKPLWESLKQNGTKEVEKFNLDDPARKVMDVYDRLLREKTYIPEEVKSQKQLAGSRMFHVQSTKKELFR